MPQRRVHAAPGASPPGSFSSGESSYRHSGRGRSPSSTCPARPSSPSCCRWALSRCRGGAAPTDRAQAQGASSSATGASSAAGRRASTAWRLVTTGLGCACGRRQGLAPLQRIGATFPALDRGASSTPLDRRELAVLGAAVSLIRGGGMVRRRPRRRRSSWVRPGRAACRRHERVALPTAGGDGRPGPGPGPRPWLHCWPVTSYRWGTVAWSASASGPLRPFALATGAAPGLSGRRPPSRSPAAWGREQSGGDGSPAAPPSALAALWLAPRPS